MPNRIKACAVAFAIAIAATAVIAAAFIVSYFIGTVECAGWRTQNKDCTVADLTKAVTDARVAILQALAGLASLGALYFTWRNFTQTTMSTAATYNLARDARSSENFIKAVDQLGNSSVHVRVGGIFGLDQLLRTTTPTGPIQQVLTSFVRQAAPAAKEVRHAKPPEDIAAAITVLARVPKGDLPIDLHSTQLDDAWMQNYSFQNAHFERSTMERIDAVNINLTGAQSK